MRLSRQTLVALFLIATLLAATKITARAADSEDSYYMMIFAAQRDPNQARFSHTFATFVEVSRSLDSSKDTQIETHTISWLPASLDVSVLRRQPEPGVNLDLPSTLNWAINNEARITMWGPYQISSELYNRAVAQESRLRSGGVQYKAIDEDYRPGVATNCIHSVSDIAPQNGMLHIGRNRGEAASQAVLNHLRPWIINTPDSPDWLTERLGLMRYSVTIRR